jgi:Uma2 family endonuclease
MSQPQPDLVLYRPVTWRGQHPGVVDISLVVQISDASLSFDLGEKLVLYSANGIREYCIVDLKATQIHRFVAPHFKSQTSVITSTLRFVESL